MGSIRFLSRVILPALLAAGCLTVAVSAQTVYGNGTGTSNGFYYSLYSSGGSAQMTVSGGNYALSWSGVSDVVGGTGWNPGSTHTIGYNVGYVSGENNLSIYGWLTNPLVEYYICEMGSLYTGDAQYKGSVSSDGHNYSTYEHQQVNQPSIEGTTTFEQYLDNWGGASTGQNGTVTTANHFNHWNSLGMTVGSFNYQILGTESYSGGSGSVNATVWDDGSGSGGGGSGGGGNGGGGGGSLSGSYSLQPQNASGMCLDATGSGGAGTAMQLYSCWGGSNQSFNFASQGSNVYELQPDYNTGLCLDVYGNASSPGTEVDIWTCNGQSNQKWGVSNVSGNVYTLAPQNANGLRLDVYGKGTSDGTKIDVWTANGQSNQSWALVN